MTEWRSLPKFVKEAVSDLSASTLGTKSQQMVSKRILVVEDQPSNQVLIAEFLESEGYMVELICDDNAMLQTIHSPMVKLSSLPDLILMDVQLPGVDGFELIRQLKAHSLWQKVPVVAVTALAMSRDRERCLEAGADGYLSKPLNLDMVISTVRSLIGMAPAHDSGQSD